MFFLYYNTILLQEQVFSFLSTKIFWVFMGFMGYLWAFMLKSTIHLTTWRGRRILVIYHVKLISKPSPLWFFHKKIIYFHDRITITCPLFILWFLNSPIYSQWFLHVIFFYRTHILLFYFSLWQKRYRKPPSGGFQYLFIIHLFIWAIRPVFVYVQYRNVLSVSILANISPSGNAAIISIADANQDAAGPRDMIPRL